jgi:hypothetical protein
MWTGEESKDHLKPTVEIVLCSLPHFRAHLGELHRGFDSALLAHGLHLTEESTFTESEALVGVDHTAHHQPHQQPQQGGSGGNAGEVHLVDLDERMKGDVDWCGLNITAADGVAVISGITHRDWCLSASSRVG